MAAGIGADYAIYFLYRLREERRRRANDAEAFSVALNTSGRAVLFVAAAIGAGFSVEALSPYLGMRLFGGLMPLAMAVSCLAALSIMPVLVLRTRPWFIYGGAAPTTPLAAERAAASG
jgi:predicted RND superfamily exporter protein